MITKELNSVEARLRGYANLAFSDVPCKRWMKNATSTTLAVGDVVMVDPATVGSATGVVFDYTQVIVPTTAELGYGLFGIVKELGTGAGADGAPVMVLFYGDVDINLAANSGLGAVLIAANAVKTLTSTRAGGAKILARSKETGTGVKRCDFDGRGIPEVTATATNAEAITGTSATLVVTPAALHAKVVGVEEIWVPAQSLVLGGTDPGVLAVIEAATSAYAVAGVEFADGSNLIAYYQLGMQQRWNLGTITIQPYWSPKTAVSGPVVWEFAALAVGDGDRWDTGTVGTGVTSTDTCSAVPSRMFIGPDSAAMTVAGAIVAGDMLIIRIKRLASDAGDTLAAVAILHGIMISVTTSKPIDS
jgi:hypothetical protein